VTDKQLLIIVGAIVGVGGVGYYVYQKSRLKTADTLIQKVEDKTGVKLDDLDDLLDSGLFSGSVFSA